MINLGRDSTIKRRAASGDLNAIRILYCSDGPKTFKNAPSFRDDDVAGHSFSPIEPMPPGLFSQNERAPPGVCVSQCEGDVSEENAPC